MICTECGAETAEVTQFCVRCEAPLAGWPLVAADPAGDVPGDDLATVTVPEDGPVAIRHAEPSFRKGAIRAAFMAAFVLFGLVLPYPPLIAENAYPKPKVPGWAADAYWIILAVCIVALIWAFARPRRMGVRFDDRSIKVCNYFRTYRLDWQQVSYFTDGYATYLDLNHALVRHGWALSVLLHDGRGVTATGTMAPSGSPEIVMAARRAAERHHVAAKLTGEATDRPRAWLNDASEAKRQAVRCTVWLALTAIALAGTVVLVAWGAAHQGNYYLAVLASLVLLGCLLMTMWTLKERQHFLGRVADTAGSHSRGRLVRRTARRR